MIVLDASARPTFDTLLHTSRGTVFPESFYSFFHNYVSSINEPPTVLLSPPLTSPPTPHTMAPSTSVSPTVRSTTTYQAAASTSDIPNEGLPSDSDHRIGRIWADYESVEPYLAPDTKEETVMDAKVDFTSSSNSFKAFEVTFSMYVSTERTWFMSWCFHRTSSPSSYTFQIGIPN
jgi:phosphoinositide-3-kinase, regulatory subunit 4